MLQCNFFVMLPLKKNALIQHHLKLLYKKKEFLLYLQINQDHG